MAKKKTVGDTATAMGAEATKVTPGNRSALVPANLNISEFVTPVNSLTMFKSEEFEDLSLPAIIKTSTLRAGDTIIGEIHTFSGYRQGQIDSALIVMDILRPGENNTLVKAGVRGAMPVGAVLGRALGASELFGDSKKPVYEDVIAKIKEAGYIPGTILVMCYRGTGKERNNMNAPHLWDIKAKRPDGALMTGHGDRKKPASK